MVNISPSSGVMIVLEREGRLTFCKMRIADVKGDIVVGGRVALKLYGRIDDLDIPDDNAIEIVALVDRVQKSGMTTVFNFINGPDGMSGTASYRDDSHRGKVCVKFPLIAKPKIATEVHKSFLA